MKWLDSYSDNDLQTLFYYHHHHNYSYSHDHHFYHYHNHCHYFCYDYYHHNGDHDIKAVPHHLFDYKRADYDLDGKDNHNFK